MQTQNQNNKHKQSKQTQQAITPKISNPESTTTKQTI